jgi:TPR repeat protein
MSLFGLLTHLFIRLIISIGIVFSFSNQALAQDQLDNINAGLIAYKSLLAQEAETGDAEVQTTLGLMRLRGDIIKRDLKIARVWLGKAAIQNHTPAQYYLGQLLLLDVLNASDSDLNKQLIEGLFWLRKASREQHNPSQLLYAQTILESKRDNPFGHSKIEAMEHLSSCAEIYLPCTHYALSRLDQNNESTANCPASNTCKQKKNLLYILVNADNVHARYRLSQFENEDQIFWLRQAAKLGHPQASYELAHLVLFKDLPLQKEDPALLTLLNTAAEQGHIEAMHQLGILLYEGSRFPINVSLGLQWLKLAAERGHEPSREFLSKISLPIESSPAIEKIQ